MIVFRRSSTILITSLIHELKELPGRSLKRRGVRRFPSAPLPSPRCLFLFLTSRLPASAQLPLASPVRSPALLVAA